MPLVETVLSGLSAGTGKLCIFGHLGLVFIWSCFVSCLLLLLYYVICAPVLTEGTDFSSSLLLVVVASGGFSIIFVKVGMFILKHLAYML